MIFGKLYDKKGCPIAAFRVCAVFPLLQFQSLFQRLLPRKAHFDFLAIAQLNKLLLAVALDSRNLGHIHNE